MRAAQKCAHILFALILLCVPASLFAASELKVTGKGEVVATNVYVMQKAGSTLYTRAEWGSTFVRIIVQTSSSTKITKNYGEAATVSDIEVGHYLEVEGSMLPGGDSITISATKVKDTKLFKESKGVTGSIKSVDASTQTIVVGDKILGDVIVIVLPTTPITQGKRQINFANLKKGDKVISASGTYDYSSKTLSPEGIEIYQSKDIFVKRNFQGSIVNIAGTVLPTSLRVKVDGAEYTVYLGEATAVMSKNKAKTTLKRFAEGDTVRFYGGVRETNLNEIDAEIVRDLNF